MTIKLMISVYFTCPPETAIRSKHLTSAQVYFYNYRPRKTIAPVALIQPSANPSPFVIDTHEFVNWGPFLGLGLFLTRNILETS